MTGNAPWAGCVTREHAECRLRGFAGGCVTDRHIGVLSLRGGRVIREKGG